ncbi:uncharacterized protein cubi_00257 [Cryptosporidium ubiquitum]|uniref:Uncharacterized protein n=1 Tax=Cryptosporidium ubiquitum TaxID=857276 RepID=A0A1J4MKG8_9CRYT|nr:uncharacterized protein cubi_00257 [Cryptosporidium ubiquitum]OII74704.1 hypothetical protein cubi_00257 [Cryptosporidium ubiquitum]
MEISLSSYKFNNLFDIELDRLAIIPKNKENKSFRITVKKSRIFITNWFAFIVLIVSIRFLNYRYITLFFNFLSKFTKRKIASLKLGDIEIYHLKRKSSETSDVRKPNFINFLFSYFDIELYNVRLLTEYELLSKTFLFGTNIGIVSKKDNTLKKTSILVRRISIRFNEHFDNIFAYNILNLIGSKTFFFSVFNNRETVLSFPGLFNIDVINSENGLSISILEENIDETYSGLYLSVPLLNYILINLKSFYISKNVDNLIQTTFNWKLKILMNFKKIVFKTHGSNQLLLKTNSIELTLDSSFKNKYPLLIKFLNCYFLINSENFIKISEFIIYFNIKDYILKTKMIHLRLYSKIINLNDFNNYDVEIPKMSIYTSKIKYCEESLSLIFATHIELNSELLIIKSAVKEDLLHQNLYLRNEISDLLEFPDNIYFFIASDKKTNYSQFYTPQETIENKNLNFRTNFNFDSSIHLIYNNYNIELFIEKSKINLIINSNEKILNITDFELVQYNYLNEHMFKINTKSILIKFVSYNSNIIFQEVAIEKKSEIYIFSREISISKIQKTYDMNLSNPIIYLYSENLSNFNSMFLVFEVEYINFIFQKSIYYWKSIEIYKIIIKQSFSKDDSLNYELLKMDGDSIKVHYENTGKKSLTICIPKLLIAVNKNQIMKLSYLISYFKKNPIRKVSRTVQSNIVILLKNASIHYYNHNENICNTLLTYFGNGNFIFSINNKLEIDIYSKFNQIEIMTGEIQLYNCKTIKLPHYNETLYSKLQKRKLCCDIVYYEIFKKLRTYEFIDKHEIQSSDIKEKIFPIFISGLCISHNLHIRLKKKKKITVCYEFIKDSIFESLNSFNDKIFILINSRDYFNSNNLFSFNNFCNSRYKVLKFLEKVNDNCQFEIRFQCLNVLLMKTLLDSKYLVFNLNGISFSNFNFFILGIEKFQILIKYPSRNFSGEYLNILVSNNLIKANLEILDSKIIFDAEKLIFHLNLNYLIQKFESQIGIIKFEVSKNLINVVTDILFISTVNNQKNEIYSIKYYQGTKLFDYLLDMRQSPSFINNLMLASNEEVSLVPYFHINCLSNAKFNMKNIEIPLLYDSVYLFDLNNSFFDRIYSSYNQLYYSRYFNDNVYSINCKIEFGEINVNNVEYEIPYFKMCEFSTNSAIIGFKVCISSQIFKDLLLFFGPEVLSYSNAFERVIKIGKNQTIEIPFDLIAIYPELMILRDANTLNRIGSDLIFSRNNSINVIEIIKNILKKPEKLYFNYGLINPSLCIGLECIYLGGSCLNINIFNTVSIINISGESLNFSLFSVLNNKVMYANKIENISRIFIENIDTNNDSVLFIKDSTEAIGSFYIDFKKIIYFESQILANESIVELSEAQPQINNINYRVSLIKDNISYIIMVWSSLIIINYSNFSYLLKVVDIENREYYFLGEKPHKNSLNNSTIKRNFIKKCLFGDDDSKDFIELKINLEGYLKTSSISRQREKNIIIELENYKNLIEDHFILNTLDKYSIKINAVKLMPIWAIKNKSNFNIKITYGKYINIPIKSKTGYLDNTSLVSSKNFNYCLQEQIKIAFDGFINFCLINLKNCEPYDKLVNLYYNDELPNKEWKLVKISFNTLRSGCASNFNTGIYLEINDFNESECSNYFVFQNKTNFTYLLTQTNDLVEFNSLDLNIHRKESLKNKIWEKTLIEKFSKFSLNNNKIFNHKFSICLVPEKINNQLLFWAKERTQDNNSFVNVSFYDDSNNMQVLLEQIPAFLCMKTITKPIKFTYCDLSGKNNVCQFFLSIFKLENEVTHIVFHEPSLIQTYNVTIPSYFIQKHNDCQLVATEKIGMDFFLCIRKIVLTLFDKIDSDKVLKVKWSLSPRNSPKRTNQNLSLIPSRKKDQINFFPVFHIVFELLSINIQEKIDTFNLFDSVYKIHSKLNKLCCKISNYETIIFEVNNQRNKNSEEQIIINFNCFNLKKRMNSIPQFSKKYQIENLVVKLPFLDFNLNLNIYFRNFLQNYTLDNQVNTKDTSNLTGYILIFDIFPCEVNINELFINKKLRIFNCKYSIESPKRIVINETNSLINLSKHFLKKATYIIIRTLLNKSLNPLIYFY